MHIRITDIPGDGLDVIASRGKAWLPHVLEGVDPYPFDSCRLLSAELFLQVEGKDVFVEGAYEAEGEGRCDNCTGGTHVETEQTECFRWTSLPSENYPPVAGSLGEAPKPVVR